MDRSLKERLIGAAVLVGLAVWLIPWVLDGPERAAQVEPEALELPAAQGSASMRTQTIHLDESRDPPTPAARDSATTAPALSPPPEPSARTIEPQPSAPTVEPELSASTIEPEPPAESPSPAESPLVAETPAGEGWMVQLGSFGEEENARRLADRVTTFGFTPRVSTYTASGRPMFRVRVGPETSRERAAAVASSLSAHGFVAQVVSQD